MQFRVRNPCKGRMCNSVLAILSRQLWHLYQFLYRLYTDKLVLVHRVESAILAHLECHKVLHSDLAPLVVKAFANSRARPNWPDMKAVQWPPSGTATAIE